MMLPGIGGRSQSAPKAADRASTGLDQAGSKVSLPAVGGYSTSRTPAAANSRAQTSSADGRKKRQDGRGGRFGGRGGGRKGRGDKRRPGEHLEGTSIRADSRVGRLLKEFGGKDDWVSITILRHQMATVIQSCTRGFLVRQRWREDPQFVVDELHREIEKERQAKQRRADAKKRLENKLLTQKQKAKAGNVMQKLFGKKKTAPVGKWGKLARNVDLAVEAGDEEGAEAGDGAPAGDDSDFSDLELEDIAAVKLRARTPPWQKVENSQWVGQYNKLNHRVSRGNVDVLWDTDECAGRLVDVKSRRVQRSKSGGDGGDGGDDDGAAAYDPATQELPAELIRGMLAGKYQEKWARLGLANYAPVRYGKLNEGLLDEGPMDILTTRLRPDDAPLPSET